jgi:hypothetical protein
VEVVDDDEQRTLSADTSQQLGHGAVESAALGLGIPGGLSRERAQVGEESRECVPSCAETVVESIRIGDAEQELERFDERLIGGVDHCVGASVEHERPALRSVMCQLTDEPGLAAAGLPAEQRDLAAFALFGELHQRAQRRQLTLATDERRSRPQAERSRKPGGDRKQRRQSRKRRILGEDRPLELPQTFARFDTDLVEHGAGLPVGLESLGLSPGAVERE